MRIAHVCADPGVPVFGTKGASVHVQEVIRALRRAGHDVSLLATRIGGIAPADLADVNLHRLPPIAKGDLADRERMAMAADAALADVLGATGPYDLVYQRYSLWSSAAMAAAAASGVPGVLEVNAPLIDEQADHRGLFHRAEAVGIARQAMTAAAAVVAVSSAVATWCHDVSGVGDTVHVVPNGVDVVRLTPGPPRPASAHFTVGFVGTLKPWHGLEHLLDAMARLARDYDDLRLLVVGDGPGREALTERAHALGIAARVELTGAVDPDSVPGYLHRMDVAVAPYPAQRSAYFSPLKLYEYLAAGLPVVASAVGQVREVITDGEDGVLVAPGDPVALAAAIAALRGDPARRHRIGAQARRRAVAHHTWDAVVERILALVDEPADSLAPSHERPVAAADRLVAR